MADEFAELRKVQSIQAIALARLEIALSNLDGRFDDLREDLAMRHQENRDDRAKFQHDIRESVTGVQAIVPVAEAAALWIEDEGKPMREDHRKARVVIKCLAWLGGVLGGGTLAVEGLRAILKSKGIIG